VFSNPVFENVVKWKIGYIEIRLWAQRSKVGPPPQFHVNALSTACIGLTPDSAMDPAMIADELMLRLTAASIHVNAIEVIGPFGGTVFYPDWP
jgi:hypothetical protein